MKLSYSWLKDFCDIDVPPQELSQALIGLGLEIASIAETKIPAGIKVGLIEQVEKHPKADRLSLCTVNIGEDTPLKVVCGAPNVRPGMRAPLATIGTRLGDDFEVQKATLRGVDSFGMLCSPRELGISEDHSGIMELPEEAIPGTEVSTIIPDDSILELEITPDRGDCLSVLGLAREVSARYRLPLKDTIQRPEESGNNVKDFISVRIEAPNLCPRYTGRMIRNVRIGPSPEWMQQRLRAAGLRPINNVVDVTNYVLIHCGQPLHAFDYRLIGEKRIVVRQALAGEKITTLDGVERNLLTDDLLICDGNRPVALAGIMGGQGSAISTDTTDVFLECAFFDPIGVRKTSKRLGLSTDSSYRFERGVDYDQGLLDAVDFAATLIAQTAGGTVVGARVDEYPKPLPGRRIELRPRQISRLLGVSVDAAKSREILESLGIGFDGQENATLYFHAPTFRHDLHIEADLIEEVGRMYGYDNIPAATFGPAALVRRPRHYEIAVDTIRQALACSGLNEIVTNSLTSERRRTLLTPEINPVRVLNPLNPEMAQLRTTMLGNFLETIAYNLNRKNRNNLFFELGCVFQDSGSNSLPEERTVLAIALEGNFFPGSLNSAPIAASFYVLKGLLSNLAKTLGLKEISVESQGTFPRYLGDERATVTMGTISGVMGTIPLNVLSAFDISGRVYYAELDITDFTNSPIPAPTYTPLPRFPALERDFCFIMPEQVQAQRVSEAIYQASDLVESAHPFDLYQGEKIESGKKSIAYAVRLRSKERTLTDAEGAQVSEKIISAVSEKFGARLR